MTASRSHQTARDGTPDSHSFATRPYDLVKEMAIALVVIAILTVLLAAIFSSPDERAITLQNWAEQAPADVVATATAELAGTSTSAAYGAPYNDNDPGQKLGPLSLQRWAGVRIRIDSAAELVIDPLRSMTTDAPTISALQVWDGASPEQRTAWATTYATALTDAPDGDPAAVAAGDYGPVPTLTHSELVLAASGSLEGLLAARETFYAGDSTRPLLLLADGTYLEDRARTEHLGGDQWGMMNETGNYPGQPWLWGYSFWYQVKPFSTSGNGDALVWGVMVLLTATLVLLPWIPGLRRLPRRFGIHRLIWRSSR